MTSKQLQGTLEQHNVKISTSCIRRHLISVGMIARRSRRKPLLNRKQQKKRLDWAKEHRKWTAA